MLGWILFGLAAAAVGVVVISGMITRSLIKEKMKDRGIEEAVITAADKCNNIVKLKDLHSDKTIEIIGDDVDYELREYDTIIA